MLNEVSRKILFVDDEAELLLAMSRTLRSEHFDLVTAGSGTEALEKLEREGPFAVIVSDLRMPNMNGIELLRLFRQRSPDTVRVLFTGQPDMEIAISAINEVEIFRFMTKPCGRVMMAWTLKSAVEQYRLVTAERVLTEQTLQGSVQALMDVLAAASPAVFGRAVRLRHAMSDLLDTLHVETRWPIEVATAMSQIGCVTLPEDALEHFYTGEELSEEEQAMVAQLPVVAERILSGIPRLEEVRAIIRHQHLRYDGHGIEPGTPYGEEIPWGARALRVIVDLDTLESSGASEEEAFDALRAREGVYDHKLLESYAEMRVGAPKHELRELPLSHLRPGMVVAQDVKTTNGMLFLARGQEVTASLVQKLHNFGTGVITQRTVRVILRELAAA